MKWRNWSLHQRLIVTTFLTLTWITPTLAQTDKPLIRAEVYKLIPSVQLLLHNQTQRPAQRNDVIVPRDAVKTGVSSEAQLFFNDKSLIRVDQKTTFRFDPGYRRFNLPNLIALGEIIPNVENGRALILTPPGSVVTVVETPGSQIRILAADCAIADNHQTPINTQNNPICKPAPKATAVLVAHHQESNTTQVFALTDGDINISDSQDKKTVALKGGQTVAIRNGIVGNPQEFDLPAFYKTISLASGLGPGQEKLLAQESTPVQETLKAIRIETLAALKNQAQRFRGFTRTFLSDALNGTEGDLNPRPGVSVRIINPEVVTGTYYKTSENTAVFYPDNNSNAPKNITVDFDQKTITIDGNTGVSSNAGLSGNNARGSVINANGQITQLEVIGVNGEKPQDNVGYRGTLTTGIRRGR
ncbi:FecR domain-containing protein [Anabaena minutissima FACHB-250]|nr:FecR domain-containing protein [Anabaena minutissima FACHB-250]